MSAQVVEQVIRPTGLVDPEVVIMSTKGQVDDLIVRIEDAVSKDGRVLVTTLTKKMAEDLTDYLADAGIRVQYLHSDIDTITRIEILRELRLGNVDVIVGINLLREGLDLPEVTLVAILDADKEGFLRSAPALIQTMGRAARNVDGKVVLYADTITGSMREAVGVTQRRRQRQIAYNAEHGIDPQTIRKSVTDILERLRGRGDGTGGQAEPVGRARHAAGRGAHRPVVGGGGRPDDPHPSWPSSCPSWRPRCAPPRPSCASRRRRSCATSWSSCARRCRPTLPAVARASVSARADHRPAPRVPRSLLVGRQLQVR